MRKDTIKFASFLVFIFLIFGLLRFTPLSQYVTINNIQSWIAALGIFGMIGFVLIFSVGNTFLIPGTLFFVLSAISYGPVLGSLLAFLGITLASVLSFSISRKLGSRFVMGYVGNRFKKYHRAIQKHGTKAILALRLMPAVPASIINYGSGLTDIRFRDYFLGTAIGLLPMVIIGEIFYFYLGTTILQNNLNFPDFLNLGILLPFGFLMSLNILVPLVFKRYGHLFD